MKHNKYFDDFLKDHINLNQSRLTTLDKKVETVTDLLKSKLPNYRKFSEQGSYAHGTIIKPVRENDEFDADILIFVKDDNFDPDNFQEDYISQIYEVFQNNANYKDIVQLNTRCVTVDYAGDFHLDIVPCIEHGNDNYICNRIDKKYEKTDGDGYKKWLAEKNRTVSRNHLKKVTRLFKFLRDHKSNYSIPSILLTTLLGDQINFFDKDSDEFQDLPQTLKTLSNRVNNFLQANPNMPTIRNPVLHEENFNRKWDQTKYRNFREKFDIYNRRINEAFEEKDHNESVKKWRKLFGEDFGELRETKVSNTPAIITASGLASVSPHVYATKPYASSVDMQQNRMRAVIRHSTLEMQEVNRYFPNLFVSEDVIKGEIDFSVKYKPSISKHNKYWKIVPCSSPEQGCIQDVYEIEIRFSELRDGKPKVFEIGGRLKRLAEELNLPIINLHLYPNDEDCCLGIFLPNPNETLSKFILNKVYPYFVWQAYFSKYRKIPPVGEWPHDGRGHQEFIWHIRNTGRNHPCPCGSGKKFKTCCYNYVR